MSASTHISIFLHSINLADILMILGLAIYFWDASNDLLCDDKDGIFIFAIASSLCAHREDLLIM